MTSFYIVPPRKTQLGDNGISISGTLGVITTNPGGAAITGVGALKLDTTYSPTWTGIHTFTQPIIFAGSQVISSTLISTAGQTAGDLFYYTGTSWSRLAVGSNNQVLQSFGGGIGWTGGVNLSNVITGNLKIGSLNGVLKASSGVISGNSGIGDLSNVILNLPANNNFLKYNGTNWVNSPIPLSDHNIIIRFLNGYTPVQTGVDIEVAIVPYEPSDGTTVLEYTITRIIFQVEIAGTTTSQITIERALNGQEFDDPMTFGNTIGTLSLGNGVYTVYSTGPFFKIYSGERLRLNINSIGTGAQQWTVQIEGTAGNPYNGTNAGITSINSLAAQLQTMVVGSGGTDFNISSLIDTHTFNIPSASSTNRGLVTTGNQIFSGVKTFNNTTISTSSSTGSVVVSGGVGIGESLNVGGNVVVGNNLILNNPIPVESGGTGITALGSANTFLSVNASGSSLEYKNLIAGSGITINFNSSNVTFDVTGSANTGNIGFNNDVIYNTLNNTIYISPSDQYIGYSYIAVPNDNDASVAALAIGNLIGSIEITSGTSISSTYTWRFNSNGSLSGPYYTFPNNAGSNGQALITDGVGALSWGNVSSSGSGGGISSLNGISYINYPVQNFAVGSVGTNFNIVSIGSTHTFNLPEAGAGSSGIVTTSSQIFSGVKTFNNNLIAQSEINVSGASNLISAVGVSSSLNVAGGFGVTGATLLRSTLQVNGITTLTNNTNAGSTTSGSLVVTGGIGLSGTLYVGSGANINSNNVSGITTTSGFVFSGNSLTTGTGAYIASNSLTTGKLLDVAISGNTATGARTGINVTVQGANVSSGLATYGIFSNNTSTGSGTNIALGIFASGGTNNIPLRLGLNTSRYINLFINSEGNGLTLSPTATGTPFLALGGYSGVAAELRLLQSGGFGDPNYVALKAPVTVTNRYELIFPDNYPSSSGMTLVGTGTTQVTLSWSSLGAGGIGGTINAGDQYKLAFYVNPNGSSVIDDAQALNYSTSGANLTINSTAASVTPLKLVGAVSQTADLLQVATSSSNIFTIDKDGISTYTNNLSVTSTTASTSSSTGALTVTGGLGVQGKISVGTGMSVAGGANFASTVEINTLNLLNALSISNGGTGIGISGLPNRLLGMNSTSSSLEYKNLNAGSGVTISFATNSITISSLNPGVGISSLNTLTASEQLFATGSSGTTFNIVSSGSTHTFNLPAAGSGSSGIITTGSQIISGNKSFTDIVTISGLGVTNSATFRSTVDIYSGLGVTGSVLFRDTLSVSGVASLVNSSNASSTTNGALIVSGGVGVGGTIYTNNLYVSGSFNLSTPLSIANGGTGSGNGSITGSGALTFTAGGSNTNINLVPQGTGTVDVSNKRITSLATPISAYDAATKAYVDQIAQGINYHDHVEAATTAGLGATYQNGSLGVGATLQASPAAGWSTSYSDGVLLNIGDRLLVKNQSGSGVTIQNGIYVVSQLTSPWILTRASDSDNSIPGSVAPGDTVWVAYGDTQQYSTWTQSYYGTGDSSGGILIGTDPISYIQTAGAGSYNGDSSTISISGSIISIAPGYVGQTSIITLGTISTGLWNASVIMPTYGGTGASSFTLNGVLYGNGVSAVQSTQASSAVGAILTTATSGGAPVFANTLQGQYVLANITNSISSTTGALSIAGGLGVSGNIYLGSNLIVNNSGSIGSNLNVSANANIYGGLGVTGVAIFGSNVTIQSGGLGVTGAATFSSSISANSLSLSTPLPISSGGTGLGTTSFANYILGMNNSSLGLEYKQLVEGSNITITHGSNSVTIAAASTSATPGGPNSAIQYNGSGTLAGNSAFLWDNSSQRIDIKNTTAIGVGTTTGFLLQNSTATTVGSQLQFSPGIEQVGRAWKTSGSPATDTLVRYLQMVEVASGATPAGAITWKSSIHNAANQGPTYVKRAEISTNYGLGIYESTGVYKSSIINSPSASTDIYYTLPASLPSTNQVLSVTGLSVSSVTLSWIVSGTVAPGVSGTLAYYAGTGTTVDDATGLSYASSGTHLTITSQTATDIPLRLDGNASSSVNLLQVRKGVTDRFVINSSGDTSVASTTDSTSSTTGAVVVTGGVGIGASLYVAGNIFANKNITITQTTEKFNNYTTNIGSGATVTFNSATAGNIIYINTGTVSGNWTLDITNLSLNSGFSTAIIVTISQGATAYMPTVVKIDGTTQTIVWQGGGGVPAGNANKYDFITYSVLCTGSNTYVVFGQLVSFG